MFYQGKKSGVIRQELWDVLRHGIGRTGRAYEFVSASLILLSVAVLPLEFADSLHSYTSALIALEIALTALFTFDYFLHIYAAPRRVKYIFSFYGLVDLLSVLPFFLGAFGTPYLRVFRLVRLLRFWEFEAAAGTGKHKSMQDDLGLAEGESVEMVVAHHPLYLLINALPSAFATMFAFALLLLFQANPIALTGGILLLIFALVLLWRTWLNFSYDVIYVTTHRLVFFDQFLLGRSINQINYHAITNVQPAYTSILGYVFGYGLLTIETPATEQGHIELHMVKHHEKAGRLIMHKCFGHHAAKSQGR
jgi:hypothetical protein